MPIEFYERTPDFADERGTIMDIVNGAPIQHIAIITSVAGAVRGNHYHVHGTQYDFLIDGRMELIVQEEGRDPVTRIMVPGELAVTSPGVRHAMRFLEPSRMLVFTTLPRDDGGYEADTVRLDAPLI